MTVQDCRSPEKDRLLLLRLAGESRVKMAVKLSELRTSEPNWAGLMEKEYTGAAR